MKKPAKKEIPQIFDAIEMEIIRADIAMLKEQEIKLGNYEKWLKSQKIYGPTWRKSNREIYSTYQTKEWLETMFGPGPKVRPKIRRKKLK